MDGGNGAFSAIVIPRRCFPVPREPAVPVVLSGIYPSFSINNSSSLMPSSRSALNHFGRAPIPFHVCSGSFGFMNFGGFGARFRRSGFRAFSSSIVTVRLFSRAISQICAFAFSTFSFRRWSLSACPSCIRASSCSGESFVRSIIFSVMSFRGFSIFGRMGF